MTNMAGVADLRGWQWLFLIEGAPAVGLGVIAYFVLPDRPATARFLSADEKARIERDLEGDDDAETACGTFSQALRSPRTYVLALVYFAFYSTQSILLLWVPTLLRNAGVRDLGEIGWRTSSDLRQPAPSAWPRSAGVRTARKSAAGTSSVAESSPARAFFLLPLAARSPNGTSLCLIAASVTIFAFLALFWTVPTAVFGKGARAGGIALVSSIGASGSALSPAFIGWTQVLTGSLFGAIAVLAFVFLSSMAALYVCAPAPAKASRPKAPAFLEPVSPARGGKDG